MGESFSVPSQVYLNVKRHTKFERGQHRMYKKIQAWDHSPAHQLQITEAGDMAANSWLEVNRNMFIFCHCRNMFICLLHTTTAMCFWTTWDLLHYLCHLIFPRWLLTAQSIQDWIHQASSDPWLRLTNVYTTWTMQFTPAGNLVRI